MTQRIKEKVLSGLAWTYGERITAQLVSLVVSIVLARILSPEAYGIISLVLIFITLANVVVSDGFGSALVQKKEVDNTDFSSMLFFSTGFGVIIYIAIFFFAPYIANYYGVFELIPVIRVLSIKIPIASINSIQQAYVTRRMEFKKFFFATIIGTISSGIVGIYMAYSGFGVWALVAQYLTNSVMDTAFLAITIGWKPVLVFDWNRVKSLIGFGSRILLVGLMMSLYTNIRNLIIGKRYSVVDLSYSNKGQQFPSLISVNINASITKVLFPAISNVQDNTEKVKLMTRRAVRIGTFLLSPILVGLAAISPTFVSVVLTDKWLPCVPYLRIMCLVYLLQPIQTAGLQAMKAVGESKTYLRLEVIRWISGLIVLMIAVFWFNTVYYVVFSALVAEVLSTLINWPTNKHLFNYMYKEQFTDVIGPFIASAVMYIVVSSMVKIPIHGIALLILQIITGGIVYLLITRIMRLDSLSYTFEIIKSVISRIRREKDASIS